MVSLIVSVLIAVGATNLFAVIAQVAVGATTRQTPVPTPHPIAVELFSGAPPLVSVHVAVYDEPADIVIATLDALARLQYPAFEVIVIDNNTPDRAAWQPVADHAAKLGPRFRFHHFDGVEGAKAGALNLALELTAPSAAYVGIVDADYQVSPDFIATAVAAFGPSVQFVQFPQAYRGAAGADAIVAELSNYFATFPRAANCARASLLTGTLSLISTAALRRVGGWPTGTITEDAELGLRLWGSGARGLYIDREAGRGLLPMDLAGLRLQRRRWVTGNVQTLVGGLATILRMPQGYAAVLAQLTAWVGLLAIPLVTLLLAAAERAVPVLGDAAPEWAWRTAEVLSVASFALTLLGHVARAVAGRRLGSLAVTWALLWTSSFAWFDALRPRRPRFRRTPKVASRAPAVLSLDTAGSSVALLAGLALFAEGAPGAGFVLLLSAGGLLTAPLVDHALRRAAAGG